MPDADSLDLQHAAPPSESVGRLARAGAKWSLANLIVRQMLAFGTTAVIARLLTNDDYGLFAEVMTLTAFLTLVADMGLSWATVQRPNLKAEEVNSLFWLSVILGGAVWGLCVLASPVMVWFYERKELVPICVCLGAGLFITALATQPMALLKRQLRQKEYATSQTVSSALGGVAGIAMALWGWGYWALVGQMLAAAIILLALTLHYSGFRPARPRFSGEIHSLLRFGGYIGICNIITFFQLYLDSMLIGRFWGAGELGYYNRAYFLRTLPALYASMAITDVMIASLAALAFDRARFAAAYHKALGLVAYVGCFAGMLLGVTAAESVHLIYGPKWEPVVPLVIWLSFPALVLPLYQTSGWLFIASGKAKEQLMLTLLVTPIVAAAFLIGVHWGSLGVAIAAACSLTIPVPAITLYCAHRAAGIDFRATLRIIMPIWGCCLAALAVTLGVDYLCRVAELHWLITFAIKVITATAAYALATAFFARPILRFLTERVLPRRKSNLVPAAVDYQTHV